MSAECIDCGRDLTYPAGAWPVGSCLTCGLRAERDAAVARAERAEAALRDIADRPTVERNPDGVDQAAWTMQLIAREALEAVPSRPKEAP